MDRSEVKENAVECSSFGRVFRLALACATDELFATFQMYAACACITGSNLKALLALVEQVKKPLLTSIVIIDSIVARSSLYFGLVLAWRSYSTESRSRPIALYRSCSAFLCHFSMSPFCPSRLKLLTRL
jgi:hypothetical protein